MLTRVSALLLCLCLLWPSAAGAEGAPRNTKPFQRFKVLLGGLINDTAPFDVPFIVWGDIDPSMTEEMTSSEVTLLIGELRSGTDCSMLSIPSYSRTSSVKTKKWSEVDYKDRGEDVPTDPGAASRRQFEMIVPPLKPKKFYCFLFQVGPGLRPTPTQAATLAAAILPAYQEFLRRRGVQKELGDEQSEPLRQELIQAMRAANPIRNMSPRSGTVFDPNAKPEDVAGEFRTRWSAVNEQHGRAVRSLATWTQFGSGSRNEEMLANWRKWRAGLGRLAAAIPAADAEIKALGSLRDEQIARVLVGLPDDGPDEVITDLWDQDPSIGEPGKTPENDPCPIVAPLSARCRQIDRTRARLQRLQTVLRAAESTLTAAKSPDSGGITQVLTDLGTTLEDLDDRKINILTTQRAINLRHERMVAHVKDLEGLIPTEWLSMATTHAELETRRGWYMSSDTGLAVGLSINEIMPYAGTNIYFWPVNTQAPPGPFRTRFSTLIGFTWTDNILKAGERASLYGQSVSLVLGAGWRLTEIVKITAGTLTFKGLDPNPLVNDPRLRMTPFLSISGDFDVAKILGGLFGNQATPPKTIGAGQK